MELGNFGVDLSKLAQLFQKWFKLKNFNLFCFINYLSSESTTKSSKNSNQPIKSSKSFKQNMLIFSNINK